MNLALVGTAGAVILAAGVFLLLFRHMLVRGKEPEANLEWCRDFSIARYRPMERLFVEEDYDFLATHPGFHPGISRKLRAERRRIFRHYLRCLSRDFDRLLAAAKLVLVHAAQDRPDLATMLLKQRLIFGYAMAVVRVRLALQTVGVGTVDVRRLVGSLESMRDQLRMLTQQVQANQA
jgi:hypothetical protein